MINETELFKVLDRFQCLIEEWQDTNCKIYLPQASTNKHYYEFHIIKEVPQGTFSTFKTKYSQVPIILVDTDQITLYASYYSEGVNVHFTRSFPQADAYLKDLT